MQILTLKNMGKNLTLIAAGALMATIIAVPLSGSVSASHDAADDGATVTVQPTPPTFTLVDGDGNAVNFTLTANGVGQVLTLVEETADVSGGIFDEDDDE